MMKLVALAFTLVACFGDNRDATPAPEPVAVRAVTPVAPSKPDCEWVRHPIEREVRSAYVAKDHPTYYRRALEMVPAVPKGCQLGWWYLAIARLLDLGIASTRTTLGFATPEEALAAALRQPDDAEVLERVAQVEALGREIRLPVDACKRARSAARRSPDYAQERNEDSARYVCARVAIIEGNGVAANAALDELTGLTAVPDLELVRAQAAKLMKDRGSTIRHARLAIAAAKKLGMRVTDTDRDAVLRLAEALAR